jgi:hypothetical protein
MLKLDSTLKSLEVKLAGVVATTELPFVVGYAEMNTATGALTAQSENDGVTTGATAVVVIAAPGGANLTRKLDFFSLVNVDTAPVTATIQVNNNGTKRIVFQATLAVGDQIAFVDVGDWVVFDVNGAIKGSSSVSSIIPVTLGGTGLSTLTSHGVLTGAGVGNVVPTAEGATNTVLHGNTGAAPTFSAVVEADITLADNTTGNVSTTKHGFVPKAPNIATQFLDGTGAFSVPASGGALTLLEQWSGTVSAADANPGNLGTCALGTTAANTLTAKDELIFVIASSTLDNTGDGVVNAMSPYVVEDSVALATPINNPVNNSALFNEYRFAQSPSSAKKIYVKLNAAVAAGVTMTTDWTGAWTFAAHYTSITWTSGALYWRAWLYKLEGQ